MLLLPLLQAGVAGVVPACELRDELSDRRAGSARPPVDTHRPIRASFALIPGRLAHLIRQDQACHGAFPPVWAPPGSHPSIALIGEIAARRAANGINPQDPRPTGGTQLQTLPALWKQRLDRDIAVRPIRQTT